MCVLTAGCTPACTCRGGKSRACHAAVHAGPSHAPSRDVLPVQPRCCHCQCEPTTPVQVSGAALLADTIPAHWEAVWEGPPTPQEYCSAVVARAVAIERWHQRCCAGSLLSGALELSALFHPATFLNALRQQSARALKAPMDSLKLATCWNSNRLQGSSASLTVQLGGLLVQGAQFDGVKLAPVDQVGATAARPAPCTAALPLFTAACTHGRRCGEIKRPCRQQTRPTLRPPLLHQGCPRHVCMTACRPVRSVKSQNTVVMEATTGQCTADAAQHAITGIVHQEAAQVFRQAVSTGLRGPEPAVPLPSAAGLAKLERGAANVPGLDTTGSEPSLCSLLHRPTARHGRPLSATFRCPASHIGTGGRSEVDSSRRGPVLLALSSTCGFTHVVWCVCALFGTLLLPAWHSTPTHTSAGRRGRVLFAHVAPYNNHQSCINNLLMSRCWGVCGCVWVGVWVGVRLWMGSEGALHAWERVCLLQGIARWCNTSGEG
jgi:hypothetical protein